jgi:hypothetical protein
MRNRIAVETTYERRLTLVVVETKIQLAAETSSNINATQCHFNHGFVSAIISVYSRSSAVQTQVCSLL